MSRDWETSNTIVTVSQELDPETAGVLGESVEPGEQVVEDLDQLPRVTPGGQG